MMYKKIFFLGFTFCYFLNINAQTNSQPYIITYTKDTIRNITILRKVKLTNENQVTYKNYSNKINTLNAEEIYSYSDTINYYLSTLIKPENKYKLISYFLGGPLNIGKSMKNNGKNVYWLRKKLDSSAVCLDEHKFNLPEFLTEYLPDYQSFTKIYKKKIYYTYKSLGEFVSAYNEFKSPEIYRFTKFKNIEVIEKGLFTSYNILTFKYDNYEYNFNQSTSCSLGFFLKNNFTNNMFLNYLTILSYSKIISDEENINLYNLCFEPSFFFKVNLKGSSNLNFGTGLFIIYNFNSYVDNKIVKPNEFTTIGIKNLGLVGYSLSCQYENRSRFILSINYIQHNIQTDNFSQSSIVNTSKNGKLRGLRFGIGYKFNSTKFLKPSRNDIVDIRRSQKLISVR
ncbi:MAG: hypothetical protein KAT68_14000 [Bacteroidales bacterium]|nr:hypothetical protein [Bacteroidales bacterium]